MIKSARSVLGCLIFCLITVHACASNSRANTGARRNVAAPLASAETPADSEKHLRVIDQLAAADAPNPQPFAERLPSQRSGSVADGEPLSKSRLQEMYVAFLREEGYVPTIDPDGDVQFKVEGSTFYIDIYDDDPEYFSIVFPNFWEIESKAERAKIALVASQVMRTTKLVGVFTTGTNNDNTSMRVSVLLSQPEDFKLHAKRMITVLLLARSRFVHGMNSE